MVHLCHAILRPSQSPKILYPPYRLPYGTFKKTLTHLAISILVVIFLGAFLNTVQTIVGIVCCNQT